LNGVHTISGTYAIDIGADGVSDTLASDGDLDISGLFLDVQTPAKGPGAVAVLTASGTITGPPAGITHGFFTQLSADGHTLFIQRNGGTVLTIR
ncbi:MAG: hypothetical protein LBW77_06510, partial [Verrucomicrobiota bacterium]|nr:hypothetical protein [Verrucomicrobiota bacterium]